MYYVRSRVKCYVNVKSKVKCNVNVKSKVKSNVKLKVKCNVVSLFLSRIMSTMDINFCFTFVLLQQNTPIRRGIKQYRPTIYEAI